MFFDFTSDIDLGKAIVSDPLTISADAYVSQAIALMSEGRTICALSCETSPSIPVHLIEAQASCILVIENVQLVGILTERDIVQVCVSGQHPDQIKIVDVMSRSVITLQASELTDVFVPLNLFQRHRIRHLPIVDAQQQVTGLITHESLQHLLRPIDLLRLRRTAEIMTSGIVYAKPNAAITHLTQLMTNCQVSSVVIVEDLPTDCLASTDADSNQVQVRPIGIVTERDIVQFLALGLNLTQVKAQSVMSTPVFTIHPDTSLWDARQLMQQYRISRVVVTDLQQRLLGIVSQSSLLNLLNPLEIYKLVGTLGEKVCQLEAEKLLLLKNRNDELERQVQTELVQRQRTEATLYQSEATNRAILQAIPDLLIRMSADGTYLDFACSETASSFYPEGVVQDQAVYNALYPILAKQKLHYVQQALASKTLQIYEQELVIGNKVRHEEVRIVPNGQDEVLIIVRDITDRKRAEIALEYSEARFRSAFETAAIGISLVSPQGRFLAVNQALCQMFGYSEAELLALTFQEITYPEDLAADLDRTQALFRGEIRCFHMEKRYLHKQGQIIWALLSVSLIRDSRQQPFYIIAQVQNITDRQRAEAALQQNEAQNRAILAAIPDLMFRVRADGTYLGCVSNASHFDILSSDINPIGRKLFEILPAELAQRSFHFLQAALKTGNLQTYEQKVEVGSRCQYEEVRVVKSGADEVLFMVRDISERKQAEADLYQLNQELETRISQRTKALKLSEERWQLALQGSNHSIWDWDLRTNQVFRSNRWREMRGLQADDLTDTQEEWLKGIHPDDRDSVMTAFANHLAGHTEFFEMEYRILHKNGFYFWILDRGKALRDEAGQVIRISGTETDISRRKQAEMENQLLRERLQFVLSSSPAVIFSCKPDGNYATTFISDNIENLTGYTAEEFVADPDFWVDRIHPDDVTRVFAELDHLFAHESHIHEYRFQHQDGCYRWLQDGLRLVRDEQGQPVEVIGYCVDVSDRKRTEGQLQDLNTALHNAVEGISYLDIDGYYLSVNRAYANLCGYEPEELVGRPWQKIVHPENIPEMTVAYQQMLKLGKVNAETRGIRKDGSVFHKQVTMVTACDEQGNLKGHHCFMKDISDRKQAEEELRQSNERLGFINRELERATRLKDEFLANMSHELRTPLNAILGMSEGLQESVFGELNERQHQSIATIERSGRHLLELINDILDLSKIEAGKLELEIGSVSVNHLCNSSLAFVRQQAIQKKLHLVTEIPQNLEEIAVDERRLRQVLINLLNNAVKFTQTGGSITLKVQLNRSPERKDLFLNRFGGTICFSVIDTGIGIAAEDIGKLFQPFVQIDSRLNRQHAGTGLGLALVKQIVELHGGYITVSSKLSQGSCFTVCLPCDTASRSKPPMMPALSTQRSLQQDNQQVLIVENSPAAAEQIARYLHELRMPTAIHTQGEGTLEIALDQQPALIILDILLPNQSGWETLQQLKEHPQTKNIPVLMVSVVDERSQGLTLGASEYLVKPISREQLHATLSRLGYEINTPDPAPVVFPNLRPIAPLILLAEDNQANIDTFSDYLESRGYQMLLANNGQTAVDIVKSQKPDLILMDIQMPGMDGLEAMRQIRAIPEMSNIPIIALTALAMPGDQEQCLLAGASAYLSKPVKLKQLAEAIQQLLNQS